MARRILVYPTLEEDILGFRIEEILTSKRESMSVEAIQEALLKTDIDGEFIEASVDEILELLNGWLMSDHEVTKEGNLYQIPSLILSG